MGWNGNVAACVPGTNAVEYSQATITRVNFFRALAGLPGDVALNLAWSEGCMATAITSAAANNASHNIPPDWPCATPLASEFAAKSNVLTGDRGPTAIDKYIDDPGANNPAVGHRRWILYPPQKTMGTGSIPRLVPHQGVNVLRVIGGHGDRPSDVEWVAWPPPGFVPVQVTPRESSRWSFSIPGAGFATSSVRMARLGTNVPVVLERVQTGSGDNTLVWRPTGVPIRAPAQDAVYRIWISNVSIQGKNRDFYYEVTLIDPARTVTSQPPDIRREPSDTMFIDGSTAELSFEATGGAPMTYQWFFEGQPIEGATNTVLSVKAAGSAQAGEYHAQIRNDRGIQFTRRAKLSQGTLLRYSVLPGEPKTLRFTWDGTGVLQQSSELSGAWRDVEGASPQDVRAQDQVSFFRLKR